MHPQPPRLGCIQLAIFRIGEGQGPSCRAKDTGFGIIGGPVIAPTIGAICARLISQRGTRFAPDTRLAGPNGKVAAIQRQIAHLLSAAPEHIIYADLEIQRHAILRSQGLKAKPPAIRRDVQKHPRCAVGAGKLNLLVIKQFVLAEQGRA